MEAISIRPILDTTTCTAIFQSRKSQKPNNTISVKRFDFYGRLDCRKSISRGSGRENRKTKTGLNLIRANISENEEGVQALEQEVFIEGSALNVVIPGGLEATLNSLSKWLVASSFGVMILWRHDAEALWVTIGCLMNGILSIKLKEILNQERPATVSTLKKSDPGMPSSHAQSIFYTTTFLTLLLVERYGINGLTKTLSGLLFILGAYFSWLRVSQQLHTVSQVIVGAVIGSIFSVFWVWSWNTFVLNLFVCY